MIELKVEKIGDRVAVVLTEEAQAALNARIGETIYLDANGDGTARPAARETGAEDQHARGRAFLRRYNKSFEQLES